MQRLDRTGAACPIRDPQSADQPVVRLFGGNDRKRSLEHGREASRGVKGQRLELGAQYIGPVPQREERFEDRRA